MSDFGLIGRWLVFIGLGLALVGGVLWLLGRVPGLKEFPGTLRFNLGGLTCVVPILGSILLSVLFTLFLNLLLRLLRR